jgi:hypothetical protein
MNCSTVLREYLFLGGNCCSLNDFNGGRGCRLVVNGPSSFCTFKTRYDQKYFSYYIASFNKGRCPSSQYRVPLPPTPAPAPSPPFFRSTPYSRCFETEFRRRCTGGGDSSKPADPGCPDRTSFRRTFQGCSSSNPIRAARCVGRAADACRGQSGSPSPLLCTSLARLAGTGQVSRGTCLRLRMQCRRAGGTSATAVKNAPCPAVR